MKVMSCSVERIAGSEFESQNCHSLRGGYWEVIQTLLTSGWLRVLGDNNDVLVT